MRSTGIVNCRVVEILPKMALVDKFCRLIMHSKWRLAMYVPIIRTTAVGWIINYHNVLIQIFFLHSLSRVRFFEDVSIHRQNKINASNVEFIDKCLDILTCLKGHYISQNLSPIKILESECFYSIQV